MIMEDKELIRREYYVKFAKELMEHIGFDPYARTKGEAFHNFLEMKEKEMEQQSADLPKIDVSKIKYGFVKLWEKRLINTANCRPSAYEREYDEYIDAFLKEYYF